MSPDSKSKVKSLFVGLHWARNNVLYRSENGRGGKNKTTLQFGDPQRKKKAKASNADALFITNLACSMELSAVSALNMMPLLGPSLQWQAGCT